MRRVIVQPVVLPAMAGQLFATYLDPAMHAAEGEAGRIDLVHIDVPEQDYREVTEGWEKYYWMPWRRYLVER